MYDASWNTLGDGWRDCVVDGVVEVYYDGEWLADGVMVDEYDCGGDACVEIDYGP